jgi:H+/Cl- antiporter ClcA
MASLSVIGVLVGIAVGVRAFLYLGITFLVFTIVARVVHAVTEPSAAVIWPLFALAMGLALFILSAWRERAESRAGQGEVQEHEAP